MIFNVQRKIPYTDEVQVFAVSRPDFHHTRHLNGARRDDHEPFLSVGSIADALAYAVAWHRGVLPVAKVKVNGKTRVVYPPKPYAWALSETTASGQVSA